MADVRAQVPGISASREAAQSFVSRLVMQTTLTKHWTDETYAMNAYLWFLMFSNGQGRSAGLPDAIIAAILGQLSVQIRYEALECKKATVNHADPAIPYDPPFGVTEPIICRYSYQFPNLKSDLLIASLSSLTSALFFDGTPKHLHEKDDAVIKTKDNYSDGNFPSISVSSLYQSST
ncbi:hypothetical protein KIN20_023201 [Parelaphostrongylus tenuis]|uniref:Uncharacterized protein n=1 Tax=Parelaphostrongylus tenuis TaxID=148309 RepID=A0AAD5QVR1_PARTN|nr:hypothetical protein KIN20_023201 [Parelaphostrongylus tenuis]